MKEIVKSENRLTTLLEKVTQKLKTKTDEGFDFDALGIDAIMVDESQAFKNLGVNTAMGRVKGITSTNPPTSFDMHMKTNWIHKRKGKIAFLTGTPVSNSLTEIFTLQRYLQPEYLNDNGLNEFDGWVANFAIATPSIEMSVDGKMKLVPYYSSFINLEALRSEIGTVMDYRPVEEMGLNLPKLKGGKHRLVSVPASEPLKRYIREVIVKRLDAVRRGLVDQEVDNYLTVATDGRKAGLDIRLVDPSQSDNPNSKVNVAVRDIAKTYKDNLYRKGTQLVFLDLSTSVIEEKEEKEGKEAVEEEGDNSEQEDDGFTSVYLDIKNKLVLAGVPEDKVAFAQQAKGKKLDALYAKVRSGEIAILISSRKKSGVGVNVQDRVVKLTNLDVPYTPDTMEQANARAMRQGNVFAQSDPSFELEIVDYAVDVPSFDVVMLQKVNTKSRMIQSFYSGKGIDEMEAVDGTTLTTTEMLAATSGNPLLIEQLKAQQRMAEKSSVYEIALRKKINAKRGIQTAESYVDSYKRYLEKAKKDATLKTDGELSFNVGTETITDKKAASSAIKDAVERHGADRLAIESARDRVIGNVSGFDIMATRSPIDGYVALSLVGGVKHQINMPTKNEKGEYSDTAFSTVIKNAIDRLEKDVTFYEGALSRYEGELASTIQSATADLSSKLMERDAAVAEYKDISDRLISETETSAAVAETETKAAVEEETRLYETEEPITETEAPVVETETKSSDMPTPEDVSFGKPSERGSISFSPVKERKPVRVSSNPEIDAQIQAAKGGASTTDKKGFLDKAMRALTLDFPDMPLNAFFERARNAIHAGIKRSFIAKDKVMRDLSQMFYSLEMTREDYELFSAVAFLRDFTQDSLKGLAVPFYGTNYRQLEIDLKSAEARANGNPKVETAIKRRAMIWKSIEERYSAALKDYKPDIDSVVGSRVDYIHHQVLMYAAASYRDGVKRGDIKAPINRGHLKGRHGTILPINMNLLQVEAEILSKMESDIIFAEMLTTIKEYDRMPEVKERVEEENIGVFLRKIKNPIDATVPEDTAEWARGVKEQVDAFEVITNQPVSYEELESAAGNDSAPGHSEAKAILKELKHKKSLASVIGGEAITWRQVVKSLGLPVREFHPLANRNFYLADSIESQLASAIVNAAGEQIGVSSDDIGRVLAMGAEKEPWLLPEEIFTTLQQFIATKQKDDVITILGNALAMSNQFFRKMFLLAPTKIVPFTLGNMLGDAESVFIGSPGVFKELIENIKEILSDLKSIVYQTGELSPMGQKYLDQGASSSSYTHIELGDPDQIAAIERAFFNEDGLISPSQILRFFTHGYWDGARKVSDFREGILRYSAFRYYLKAYEKNGKPPNYGASDKSRVEALATNEDKAYKLQNELLGAYDRVGHVNDLSSKWLTMFTRWPEVNLRRYRQMMMNAIDVDNIEQFGLFHLAYDRIKKGELGGITEAGNMAAKLGIGAGVKALMAYSGAYLRLFGLFGAVLAWNNLMFGDDEDEYLASAPKDANKFHILAGRRDDGTIRVFERFGAFNDFLGLFGLDRPREMVQDLRTGIRTPAEVLQDWWGIEWRDIIGYVAPPIEIIAKTVVAAHEKGTSSISVLEDMAAAVGHKDWYNLARGIPQQGLLEKTMTRAKTVNIQRQAYHNWASIERKYRNRLDLDDRTFTGRSEKGQALFDLLDVISSGDEDAIASFKEKAKAAGVKDKDLTAYARRKAPLYGLKIDERDTITAMLKPEEKAVLTVAENYYRDTIVKGLIPERDQSYFLNRLKFQGWIMPEEAVGFSTY